MGGAPAAVGEEPVDGGDGGTVFGIAVGDVSAVGGAFARRGAPVLSTAAGGGDFSGGPIAFIEGPAGTGWAAWLGGACDVVAAPVGGGDPGAVGAVGGTGAFGAVVVDGPFPSGAPGPEGAVDFLLSGCDVDGGGAICADGELCGAAVPPAGTADVAV